MAPAQQAAEIKIAVPSPVPVDGQLDLVVLTGRPVEFAETDGSCFLGRGGTFPVLNAIIHDKTSGLSGLVTGVIVSEEFRPGTQSLAIDLHGDCYVGSVHYKVYGGLVER
jgi:hypothetical protein